MGAEAPRRRCAPLARRTRVRLLQQLLRRAEAGEAAAAEVLVRLSIDAERAGKEQSVLAPGQDGAGP